jgi:hypothetical protein
LPRECTVCTHPDAVLINEAIALERKSNRTIAQQFGVHYSAVQRHRQHIPQLLLQASRAEEVAQADSLLDRLEDLQKRTQAILDEVEDTDLYGVKLGAIREMRRNLELIGEVTKELNRAPTLNLHLRPEWMEVKAVILDAVDRHPEVAGELEAAFARAERPDA